MSFPRLSSLLLIPLLGLTTAVIAAPVGKKTSLKLDVKPADVAIFVDEKPMGESGKGRVLALTPGRHSVKLVRKHVSHEESITLKAGETKVWAFDFGVNDPKDEVKVEDSPGTDEGKSEGDVKP